MSKAFKILLIVVLVNLPTKTYNQSVTNADVVTELARVGVKLKGVWLQKIKDSKLYNKMADYQKSLTTAYETASFLKQTKSILELLELVEAFACRVRALHGIIGNNNYAIPAGCGFDYKYQKATSSFNMSLDLSSIIMSNIEMTIKQRIDHLKDAKSLIIEAESDLKKLEWEVIKFNL